MPVQGRVHCPHLSLCNQHMCLGAFPCSTRWEGADRLTTKTGTAQVAHAADTACCALGKAAASGPLDLQCIAAAASSHQDDQAL